MLGVPTAVTLAWQQRFIGVGTVAVTTGLMPALIVGAVTGLRTRRWRRALALTVATGVLIGSLEWVVLRDVAYNDLIGSRQLLTAFLVVALSSFLILYALPFAIAERIGGGVGRAVAGFLASQALHPISQAAFAPYSAAPNLVAGLDVGAVADDGCGGRYWPIHCWPAGTRYSIGGRWRAPTRQAACCAGTRLSGTSSSVCRWLAWPITSSWSWNATRRRGRAA